MNESGNWMLMMGETDKLPDLVHLKGDEEKIMYKDDVMNFIGNCLDDAVADNCRLERVYVLANLTLMGWSFASKVGRVCFKDWELFLDAVKNKTYENWSGYKEAFQSNKVELQK